MSGTGGEYFNTEPVTTGTRTVTANARQLSDGNSDGTSLGQSQTDRISFYNYNPVVQPGTNGFPQRTSANLTIWTTTQTPTSIDPNTSAERTITVTGVLATDMVAVVNKPTSQAGLLVGTARVSAADTIRLTFGNDTAATITPTATQDYKIITLGGALTTTTALSPAAVGPNTTSEQQFALTGVYPGQVIFVNKPTTQAGLLITNARAASLGYVAIQFQNLTAATITPTAAETYTFGCAAGFQQAPLMTEISAALTPVSVAANTAAEQTFTIAGLVAGTEVSVTKPTVTANLVVAGARVSAANTLAVNFANNTGTAIIPPAETYLIAYFPTSAPAGGSATVIPAQKGNSASTLAQLGLQL
jgi:hypothetical protein